MYQLTFRHVVAGLGAALVLGLLSTTANAESRTASATRFSVDAAAEGLDSFGYGTMKVNGVAAEGERPLLTLMVDYPNQAFSLDRAALDYLVYGRGTPTDGTPRRHVDGYFNEVSSGRFSWSTAGLVGPVRVVDDPRTTIDDSSKTCAVTPWTCSGWGLVNLRTSMSNCSSGGVASSCFITAENGGGPSGSLSATRTQASSWEAVTLIDRNGASLMSGDQIELITYSGHWVTAEGGGGSGLSVNRTWPGSWEVFRIEKAGGGEIRHGDSISLRAPSGHFVVAEGGGGGAVNVNRTYVTAWETFRLEKAQLDAHRLTRLALDRAVAAGVDFARLDTDSSGAVEGHELALLLVNASSIGAGGQTSSFPCHTPAGAAVRVCGQVSSVNEGESLTTIAHELAHQLGTIDVYGSSCLSNRVSLMGCTPGYDSRSAFHIDPWHKLRLGWLEPRIVAVPASGYPGGCVNLTPAQFAGWGSDVPMIFYDAARGTSEFLIVENRRRAFGGYDTDVASDGAAIWLVQTNASGALATIPGLSAGFDNADLLFGAPTGVRGGNRLWQASDGQIAPRWIDGSDTRLRLRVGPFDRPLLGDLGLEYTATSGFRPRIYTLPAPASGPPGARIDLGGAFGVRGTKRARLTNATNTVDLNVVSWSCSRLVANVPAGTPPGSYQLAIVGDGSPALTSNAVTFTVTG